MILKITLVPQIQEAFVWSNVRWGEGEGSASRLGRYLPPGKTQYPLYRRPGGSQGRSEQVWKISLSPGFDSRTVQSVSCHYTDYATRPTHSREFYWVLPALPKCGSNRQKKQVIYVKNLQALLLSCHPYFAEKLPARKIFITNLREAADHRF